MVKHTEPSFKNEPFDFLLTKTASTARALESPRNTTRKLALSKSCAVFVTLQHHKTCE